MDAVSDGDFRSRVISFGRIELNVSINDVRSQLLDRKSADRKTDNSI